MCSVIVNEGIRPFTVEKAEVWLEDDVLALDFYLDLASLQETRTEEYPGLVNMGMTCYMNSYLQALFHIKLFVREIFGVFYVD